MAEGKPWFAALDSQQRYDRAVHVVDRAIDQLHEIIGLTETNRILNYSPAIASQVPPSYAANAFNLLQWSMLNYEILRLCALWDRGSPDRESILSIVDLVDDPDVFAVVSANLCKSEHVTAPNSYVTSQLDRLHKTIRVARRVSQSKFRRSLVAFRDSRLAHSLTPKNNPTVATPSPKFGYERRLLRASVAVIDGLNGTLRNSSFLFEDSFENAKYNAEAFWLSAKFSIEN